MRRPMAPLLLTLLAASAACTTFGFPQSNARPPDELSDRGRMIAIPAGTFKMGDNLGEPHEFPVHDVELGGFRIDATEVSNAQYQRCTEAGVCRATREMEEPSFNPPSHPVVGVTYNDARTYCAWLRKRLPTEAEWERAARGGGDRRYPFDGAMGPNHGNVRGAADGFIYTAPVRTFPAGCTSEGVCDLAGNAAEWVADWFSPTYYAESPPENPKGPEASTRLRSVRGGSWTGNTYEARSTARGSMDPAFSKNSVGFRCAASAGDAAP
ncbi:MAG: SUMF1/EgtB/PvdO family nonheme iron enzyme [Pseudomonadota bacterium]